MTPDRLRGTAFVLTLLAVVAGCETTGTLAPGDLTIAVDPSALSFDAGTDAAVTVTVVRGGSYQGPVTLGAQGMPEGVTVRSGILSTVESVGVVTFVADSSAAGSSASITLTATADRLDGQATAQLALTIDTPPPPSFAIALERDTVTLAPGVPDTVAVSITRENGFAGGVAFTVTGMPNGLSAAFVEDTVAGETARLALEADSTVATDTTFLLAITGSAEGFEDRIDTLAVVVAAPAAPAPLRLRIDRRPSTPDRSRPGRSTLSGPGGS